jgi:hypothetical protein
MLPEALLSSLGHLVKATQSRVGRRDRRGCVLALVHMHPAEREGYTYPSALHALPEKGGLAGAGPCICVPPTAPEVRTGLSGRCADVTD